MKLVITSFPRLAPAIGLALALMNTAEAGSRRFTYSYETTTMAAGASELESWVTWKTNKASDPNFERFDIRHEFEYGLTDRLQAAFYFADWRHEQASGEKAKTSFKDVAIELIYNLTDPNTTAFGSALYGEVKAGDDFVELEAKILLQKNMGSWVFVYNLGGEIEWEEGYTEDNAEIIQSVGGAYQINPSWSVGAELLHEIAVPDVSELSDNGVYIGPNVSWKNNRFSAALTGLWQVTTLSEEPDFQLRTIFAIDF